MNKEDVLKLAKLARIDVEENEADSLTHEFESILHYVNQVKEVGTQNEHDTPNTDSYPAWNVMRDDAEPHESGLYTELLIKEAPDSENNYIKVKKIL